MDVKSVIPVMIKTKFPSAPDNYITGMVGSIEGIELDGEMIESHPLDDIKALFDQSPTKELIVSGRGLAMGAVVVKTLLDAQLMGNTIEVIFQSQNQHHIKGTFLVTTFENQDEEPSVNKNFIYAFKSVSIEAIE